MAKTGTLDRRDMDKHVLRPVIRMDEPISLLGVEPLDCSSWHSVSPCNPAARTLRAKKLLNRGSTNAAMPHVKGTRNPGEKRRPLIWARPRSFTRRVTRIDAMGGDGLHNGASAL